MKKNPQQFNRQEFKYLITLKQKEQLSFQFSQVGLKPDPYSVDMKDNSYPVSSLYLDTLDFEAYWEKQYGLINRVKFRLRTYDLIRKKHSLVFFEIKQKYNDFIKKTRFSLKENQAQKFLHHQLTYHQLASLVFDQQSLARFYLNFQKLNLNPVILISYLRQPWLDSFYPNFRLTFDYQINATPARDLFSSSPKTQVLPNKIIMEIKLNGLLPEYLARIIKSHNLARQSLSKYCLGLETCDIVSQENL